MNTHDKNTATKAPNPPVAVNQDRFSSKQPVEPIPVSTLRFRQPTDVPGNEAALSQKTKTEGSKSWRITYLPWMRHFHVTFVDEKSKTWERLIHESGVICWDPA